MNHLFSISPGFPVPDGTTVHEIVSPRQLSRAGLRPNDGLSVALGDLPANTRSNVHVHPIVWQFSWVIDGTLKVIMKDYESREPYPLNVPTQHGVLSEPGTFFQLINDGPSFCRVLYIVGPAFVFETDDEDRVKYNDAIVLPYSWEELRKQNWKPAELDDSKDMHIARAESFKRLSNQN